MARHDDEQAILVVGATGTVGGAAVRALRAQGARVRALVRTISGPAPHDVELVRGDLRDPGAVARALEGVSAALYVSPHEPDEEALAAGFFAACEAAGARLVFVGVHVDGATRAARAVRRLVFGRMLPHYRPKFRISERARRARANAIVLMPTNFFDNDELFRGELLAGHFVQPFERPLNRVAVRDVGAAAARACLDPALPAGAYPVVGPASIDGPACAAAWSAALGLPVRFDGDDARFRAACARALAGRKREDFLATYAVIRRFTLATRAQEVARTTALLGRPPTSYAAYVEETAAAWRGRAHAAADASTYASTYASMSASAPASTSAAGAR